MATQSGSGFVNLSKIVAAVTATAAAARKTGADKTVSMTDLVRTYGIGVTTSAESQARRPRISRRTARLDRALSPTLSSVISAATISVAATGST